MITISPMVERQVAALDRAQRHWQERHRDETLNRRAGITIGITREAGTPGTSVAREVGRKLDWPVYDHELVERIAQEMGLRSTLLGSVDERRQSWLLESMRAFSSEKFASEGGYVHHLVQTLLSLASHGNCVIVGRGAAQILPYETTLRVRLVAPLESRILATAQRLGLNHEQAARWVADTDRNRTLFVRDHFHKDPTVTSNYDLLLNASRWSVAACADFIVDAARRLTVVPDAARASPL